MALDKATALQLWKSRYEKELRQNAKKNSYLDEDGDAENLFGDMQIGVWLKAVNEFDVARVTYTGDLERAFNAHFHMILGQFLANKAAHRDTTRGQGIQRQDRLDAPLSSEDEGGATLLDTIRGFESEDTYEIKELLHHLPAHLTDPLTYMFDNIEKGNVSDVMDYIRQRWHFPDGTEMTPNRLFNALMEEPEFVDFVSQAGESQRGRKPGVDDESGIFKKKRASRPRI